MKTYSSILCQIMIGALMSIGISAQADVDITDPNLLDRRLVCAHCLSQSESNGATNKVAFTAVKKSEDLMQGFLSLTLKNSYKNLYINFDFDSEIISPCTRSGIYTESVCGADKVPWKIHRRPKRLNNYTIVELDTRKFNEITIMFMFKAPFSIPKNVFASEGDYPADYIKEYLQEFLPATTNDSPTNDSPTTDNPSTNTHEMKPYPPINGPKWRGFDSHYDDNYIEL